MIRDRDCIYGTVVTRRLRAMGIRDKPIEPAWVLPRGTSPSSWRRSNPRHAMKLARCRSLLLADSVEKVLPACQMILDVTGDLFTHGRQFKQLVFNGRII